MGFKDWFMGDDQGAVPVKVQCTSCNRITVVKIPSSKTFEKWNEKTECGDCNNSNCWKKLD